jgi:geranylgeranyl diphosphate synthase, type I
MIDDIAVHRGPIVTALREIDRTVGCDLSAVNRWGDDLRSRLLDFTERGKLIRGSLVAASAIALGRTPDRAVYTIAAAVELVQTFLLIHDDIMDEDPLRRGAPAVFEQYRRHALDHDFRSAARFGESMGICAGDVAVLVGFAAIGAIDASPDTRVRLTTLLASEIAKVGVAQMADVANGHAPEAATEAEITSVYRFKTGRYTFSLPLMLGAILADADEATIAALGRWGELQGIIFQIRDDQLGLMQDTTDIGKPAGSDVAANKQTLHRLELFDRLPGSGYEDIVCCFGQDSLQPDQLGRIRDALVETGTIAAIDERVASLRGLAAAELSSRAFSEEARRVFAAIDEYNAHRSV